MDGKAFEHDEHGDTQTHFRFPQASSDFVGRDDDTDVSSAIPSDSSAVAGSAGVADSADDASVGRHGRDYTPEHEFPTWGESWGDTSPATSDAGKSRFRRRGSRTDPSPARSPEADQSEPAKLASRSSSESDEPQTDHGRHDAGYRDESPGGAGAPDFGWGGDSGRNGDFGHTEVGPGDFGGTEFGRTSFGSTESGPTESGPSDYGRTDYGRTDYGRTDYGRTEYGRTDYGHTDYGRADYGRTDVDGSNYGQVSGPPTSPAGVGDEASGYTPGGYPLGSADSGYSTNPFSWSPSAEEPPARTPSKELASTRSSRRTVRDDDTQERPNWRRRAAMARKNMPLWQELPLLLVVAFCLAVLIRTFLLQAFFIPSSSMEQTLLVGDRVLVNKIVYDVRQPERGEVIVFKGTDSWSPENFDEAGGGALARIGRTLGDLVGVSRPGEKDFIKRVIGVPGDRVSCCDADGRVYVNGKGIEEPYVTTNSPLEVPPDPRVCRSRRFGEVLVPPGQLFVMGDHRIVSQDSRCQGTVPVENVIGRAFVIVWPSGRWDTLSVPETFQSVPGPVALGPSGQQRLAPQDPSHAAGMGGTAIVLPVLVSLVVFERSRRKPRWGRHTLRR
jgi:signal peptidase I